MKKKKIYHCKEKGCNNIIHKSTALYRGGRCRSCSKKGKLNHTFGKKRPQDVCKKISKNKLGVPNLKIRGKNHPKFKTGKYSRTVKRYCLEEGCGKIIKGWNALRCSHHAGIKRCENKFYKRRMLKKLLLGNIKPNKIEKFLIELLSKLFPGEYKYVGDYSFWVGNYNPDFINKKEKKIIELFGDYWHANPESHKPYDVIMGGQSAKSIWTKDENRLNTYKKHNYKCLVVWENEFKDINNLIRKLKIWNI